MSRVKHLGSRRELENYRDLLFVLVQKDIKVRYKSKILGYLWSIASPLAFACVYFFAFRIVMRVDVANYPLMLISGIFPWQWFANSVGSSPRLFLGNAPLIKKVKFPRIIIPLSMILNHMIHFILSLPVILLFVFIYGGAPTLSWIIGIPILLAVHLMMVYGISLVLSSLNLFLRDIERLVDVVMRFVFYFTPIIYPIELIPERFQAFIPLNPVAPLIISWRELFLFGTFNLAYTAISFAYALAFLALGYFVYRKLSWRFAEVV
ncbi:ABC transporter permease [Oculatella sp. LEGE 06141]|uniref:ABC transporter permease n=1 Tax=Oculatella sp. LEGE 06141 TaxID=1828648 RepID=UPI001881B140|nr:ABC transporter permease [Oculatella sp. LEGE 06141]MBE9177869.1 ABC transporter permease [Oculatella sp. LEGE 06141]